MTECWHCGQPPGPSPVIARTPEGPREACCAGCAAAIETIHGLGLGEYYQWRDGDNPLTPPESDDERRVELALFDIPELVAPWLEESGDSRSLTLLVEGIHCAACSWLIEKALLELPGVRQASLNLASHRLRVRWQAGAGTGPRQLAERLLDLGYRPRLPARDARLAAERREQRMLLARLLVAALGSMQAMMFAVALYAGAANDMEPVYRDLFRYAGLVVTAPVVLFSGWPFLTGAWRGLRRRTAGMDLPVSLALLLGFAGSALSTVTGGGHVYYESVSMFVFFLLGSRWLEQRARLRVTLALSNLRDTLPLAVTRRTADGAMTQVPVAAIRPGEEIRVAQGEVVAVDGVVTEGRGRVDEAVMTGEFRTLTRGPGDALVAGSRLVEGHLFVRAAQPADQSRLARIGRLVEQAQERRGAGAALADAIVPWFVGAVVTLALLTWWIHGGDAGAFEHALAVLVVSCPCALALATPLSVSAALGRALQRGILVADPGQLLRVPRLTDVLFDKTGTLTRGRFALVREQVLETPLPVDEMRRLVAGMENHARHPVGVALAALAPPVAVSGLEQTRQAVSADYGGARWRLAAAPAGFAGESGETLVCLYREQRPVMLFHLADPVREEAPALCRRLAASGLRLHLASGDREAAVAPVARACGIDSWHAAMTPEEKLDWLRQLRAGGAVMMTGDGINDAPALAAADVSVAMAEGPALAREAAGLYLTEDALHGLVELRPIAVAARRVLRQNLAWALLYNLVAVPFAMAGLVPPWLAAVGMSLSSLLVTLNASRLLWSQPDDLPHRQSAGAGVS